MKCISSNKLAIVNFFSETKEVGMTKQKKREKSVWYRQEISCDKIFPDGAIPNRQSLVNKW